MIANKDEPGVVRVPAEEVERLMARIARLEALLEAVLIFFRRPADNAELVRDFDRWDEIVDGGIGPKQLCDAIRAELGKQ